IKKELVSWAKAILLSFLIVLFLNQYVFAFSLVKGSSMEPTFKGGERLFVNKFTYLLEHPDRGDIITFRDEIEGIFLVKRVVGVPGDIVEGRNGKLYRNGEEVKEGYVNTIIQDGDFGPITVEENAVFVMGDNRHRAASRDSRYPSIGLVSYELIEGRVDYIIWPLPQLNSL
ncbi:MAG: signal peptidase I, partial [Bacilli bacterium]